MHTAHKFIDRAHLISLAIRVALKYAQWEVIVYNVAVIHAPYSNGILFFRNILHKKCTNLTVFQAGNIEK